MTLPTHLLTQFREDLRRSREAEPGAWESSGRLVGPPQFKQTLGRLVEAVRGSTGDPEVRAALVRALRDGTAERMQDLPAALLKELTGLPATKAVRALCVRFGIGRPAGTSASSSTASPADVEAFLRHARSPYDLLLEVEAPSVLDLGAGDLSFAEEVITHYLPRLRERGKGLIVHCQDRLRPSSKLGGPLHADEGRLARLQTGPPGLTFTFWSGQDMFEVPSLAQALPRYVVVTCHAPANPTFAYEPSRLARAVVDAHLRQTRGTFRSIRYEGEPALEVEHGRRTLLFPPWKFDIRGPLALLDLVSRLGILGVLAAVDDAVFWELLSQLVADERARPRDVILSPEVLRECQPDVHRRLTALQVRERLSLGEVAPLREELPRVLAGPSESPAPYRFRYVEIWRGAVFDGMPTSRTARRFGEMTDEPDPWMLLLVPGS